MTKLFSCCSTSTYTNTVVVLSWTPNLATLLFTLASGSALSTEIPATVEVSVAKATNRKRNYKMKLC